MSEADSKRRRLRLAVVATHPIQYQVPIYRALAADPEIELHVFFASDHSVRGEVDPQFGVPVTWDVPMLEGYEHTFLRNRRLPLRPRALFEYYCPGLPRELSRGHFDAVFITSYSTFLNWQAIRAARDMHIPLMIRPEGNDACRERSAPRELVRAAVLRYLYRRASAYLAIGTRSGEHFLNHAGDVSRIVPSPYCVDNAMFRKLAERAPPADVTRTEIGLSGCRAVALLCGKLIPKKAPLLLARALGVMKHRGWLGLLVVGDGELRGAMEAAVAKAGIAAYAFVGFRNQTELPTYYKAADFLVLPSAWGETWGLVVNEAMNFGLPAVVSDRVGCAEDLVKEGKTGYTFPVGDAEALAAVLDRMMANPEHVREMGRKARKHIEAFSVEAAAAGIRAALRAVTTRHVSDRSIEPALLGR